MSEPMIPLCHFEKLISMYKSRDSWHDYSTKWEEWNKAIKEFSEVVKNTAE